MKHDDLTKYKKPKKDMYDELALMDIVGDHVATHRSTRPTLYQRNLMTVGHKGLELQVKKELEDKSDVDALPV